MSAEAPTQNVPGLRRPANPITSSQVEVLASTAGSVLGIVFAIQTLPALISQFPYMMSAAGLSIVVAIFGSLALASLAAIFRQWTKPIFGLVAGVYLAALIAWPFVVETIDLDDYAWIFYLCNVATGCAIVSAGERWGWALAYTVVTPALLGWLRTMPSGGGVSDVVASLDGLYCFLIGLVMLVVIVSLRHAAQAVDQAQALALESYSTAVRNHATESERVRVDALVHDNVLITLLSAARARSAETKALAARMARSAITHLSDAQTTFPAALADVGIEELAGRLRIAVAEQPRAFDVHIRVVGSTEVPAEVADALVEAAMQAMVNSVNHADGGQGTPVTRSLHVHASAAKQRIAIRVVDDGVGFDPARVPIERLGVRTSIIERVANVGGKAAITSAPGRGTAVTLEWPTPEGSDVVAFDEPSAVLSMVENGPDWS
ncbi:sensor histidine kinase [Amnibacterium flavum]|nr:ATP-binding protein [Amnibacterium flavum]